MTPWGQYLIWRDEFAKVLDPVYYTIEWLDREVAEGRVGVLSTEHAAILFDIKTYPTGAKDINGLLAAGKLDDIVGALIPAAEQAGRSLGCVGALIESREGWTRALRTQGYQPHQVSVRKALNGIKQLEIQDES